MKLDYKKLHSDILVKLNRINQPQRVAFKKIGIARSILFRISNEKQITLINFLILVDWLEKEANDYIIKPNRPNYINKRLEAKKNA